MSLDLIFEITSLYARIVALVKSFFSSVLAHVLTQMSSLSGWIIALITIERLFSRMGPDVYIEITSLGAGEATLRAAEKLFTWMTQQLFFWDEKILWRSNCIVYNWKDLLPNEADVALAVLSFHSRVFALCASKRFLTTMIYIYVFSNG